MQQQPGQPGLNPQILLSLARDNKWQELKAAVALGLPVMWSNPIGQTALHIAALWGNLETIRTLIELGADVNCANQRGNVPLHFAACAKKNAQEAVVLLLAAGARPNVMDSQGHMPYERADDPLVRKLLGGPDQRLFDYAAAGRSQDLKELITSGAVPSLQVVDTEGRHPLNLAVQGQHMDTVQMLLQVDPELAVLPDMSGTMPLHIAAQVGSAPLVKLLLGYKPGLEERTLNLNEYSRGDWLSGEETVLPVDATALHLAVESGEGEVVRLLLDAGAALDPVNYDGLAPLHLALEAQEEELVEALLAAGANPNQPSKDVASPLHMVAPRGPAKLLQLLLDAKADPGAAGADGWTPLHLAARAGSGPKVAALLAAGAAPGAVNAQGSSPLHLAAVNGHAEVVKQLLAAGADPQQQNKDGKTPADLAKTDAVKALIVGQ